MRDVKPRLGASLEGNPETDGLTKSDAEIRNDVIDELRWDPQIPDPDAIGVAVTDGAVTLTGHVATYAITINPPASPASVRAAIEDALRRAAEVRWRPSPAPPARHA